jgi:hypothetical protein
MDVERLLAEEEAGWAELCAEVERIGEADLERPGVTPDGWSVKDTLFHIAAWAADCGVQLERMRMGTWERPDEDVETQNREWFELSRTMDLGVVRAELSASRTRMVAEFGALPEVSPDAWEWFEESGPLHYEAHLRDLRAWARG